MRISAKARYAVSAMIHLAMHNGAGPVPLSEISVCQGISMSYVDQIFARLRDHGLVQGIPGPGGGCRLGTRPGAITLGAIFEALEEPGNARGGEGLNQVLWNELGGRIRGFLDGITLADLVERPEIRASIERQYRTSPWRCDFCGALSYRNGYRAQARAS